MNTVEILSQKILIPYIQTVVSFLIKGKDSRDPTFRGRAIVGTKGVCVLEGKHMNDEGGIHPFSEEEISSVEKMLEEHFKCDPS